MSVDTPIWELRMEAALTAMLLNFEGSISRDHVKKTPQRFISAMKEMFSGCHKDPNDLLTTFASTCNSMIHVKEITFYSVCAHHLLPFFGTASFAYIPDGRIVGLSKIPRLLDMYARRPQVQENLTSQVVQVFQELVKPKGCALSIRAYHMCCMSRGIRQPTSYTETTELAGNFHEPAVKNEFLQSVNSTSVVWR